MKSKTLLRFPVAVMCLGAFLAQSPKRLNAQSAAAAVQVGAMDIGGVVTGPKGPEAGVWVMAETMDLPTKFAKIVVTDDRGRYLLPSLPKANYKVWARGYGLLDSPAVQSAPGKTVNLKAEGTPDARTAAAHYPAVYWYSMVKVPEESEFTDAARAEKGISNRTTSQAQWLHIMKTDGCGACHQLGDKATREIPKELGTFNSSADGWRRRLQSGQAGANMVNYMVTLGQKRMLQMFGDWTDRIAAGEYPKTTPPRPQGVERNIVISMWDWADPKSYLHDEISTDKLNPRLNPNGLIYGSPELSTDFIPILDPVHNTATRMKIPVRDPKTPSTAKDNIPQPSPYWGTEPIWNSQAIVHNPMFDNQGRIWFTSRIRPVDNPAFCKQGSDHPSAKLAPLSKGDRQLSYYDPKTKEFTLIDTCYSVQHLNFAEDANHTLWLSPGPPGGEGSAGGTGDGGVVGWLNTKMFDATHDEQKSQGWSALILDTNGNGKRDDYVEVGNPLDPSKDMRISAWFYGVVPSPADGSVWGSVVGFPGKIVRVSPGANPPETTLAEVYEVPWNNPKAAVQGFSPRGLDIDRNGVVWTVLASGHLASFDRRKCKGPLNGPTATGQHCPEGWSLYQLPGPQFENLKLAGSAEYPYYVWVDQFNTFGLGANVPIATGNGNDALLALVNGKFVVLRVPYPMGFFAKNVDGRIDDPNTGWKGKGLWTTDGTRTPFHMEGGKGSQAKVVHFQLRPDPLAR
jgi:hypothetical protein